MKGLLRIGIFAVFGGLIFLFLYLLDRQQGDVGYYRSHLQEKLNALESRVKKIFSDAEMRQILQSARDHRLFQSEGGAEARILTRMKREGLIFLLFEGDQLKFWSSNQVIPEKTELLPEGMSLAELKNGEYLVYRKQEGGLTAFCLMELKSVFDLQNTYLQNEFDPAFHLPAGIEMAAEPSKGYLPLYSAEHRYLFSIGLNQALLKKSSTWVRIGSWLAFLISLYLIFSSTTRYFFERGRPLLAFIFAVPLPLLLRFLMLEYKYPEDVYNLRLFNPIIYSSGPVFYSLGDFLINILLLVWILRYILHYSGIKNRHASSFGGGISVLLLSSVGVFASLLLFDYLFAGIVKDSSIPLDLVNVLDINYFTLLSFILLALLWMCLYYILIILTGLVWRSSISSLYVKLLILIPCLIFVIVRQGSWDQRCIPPLIALLIWMVYVQEKKGTRSAWRPATLVFILIIALISALKLNDYVKAKENTNRRVFAEKLEKSSDPVSEFLLKDNEGKIASDSVLAALLQRPRSVLLARLFRLANQRIQKSYFGRNFSNFDVQTFLYDEQDAFISGPENYPLSVFRSAVQDSGIRKVSSFFYQLRTIPPDYIGVLPIRLKEGTQVGTVGIHISAKYIGENNTFPELLMDVKTYFERRQEVYSYAYYQNGSLLDKFGKFPYAISSAEFMGGGRNQNLFYCSIDGFDHMVYNPSPGHLIVVSLPNTSFLQRVAVFSYILAFFLVFYSLVALAMILSRLLSTSGAGLNLMRYLSKQRILFKSRIQISVVVGVLISLLIVGWVTVIYIHKQYELQQGELISGEIDNLRKAFENEMPTDSLNKHSESSNRHFLLLASKQQSEVNFFDTNGDLVYTSLAKLYDRGLVSQKMDPFAFLYMYVSGKTELINRERIGKLNFLSAYAPVRNSGNQVVGYVNVPFFSNQHETDLKISGFLNALINVYVLVFLLIGLFAFVLANSIAYPLALIQESLRRIKIGHLNETLVWKRDDEIGDLIREYNSMVKALEESADKLARSERESAWREMARQVAHEIKNPLTPLKLGIQHLERYWKNKDPNFEEKFKTFTATFIQQIDSLSAIASEFSTFAQMPPANPKVFDLREIINHTVDLFREEETVEIQIIGMGEQPLLLHADRDQLQRALNNLLKNAIQAIPDGREGLIRIELEFTETEIKLNICDNGSGIPYAIKDSIFSPNFTTKSSGMGLGLAFVKNAVENAKGHISFDSEEGKGTRFMMQLPRESKTS